MHGNWLSQGPRQEDGRSQLKNIIGNALCHVKRESIIDDMQIDINKRLKHRGRLSRPVK